MAMVRYVVYKKPLMASILIAFDVVVYQGYLNVKVGVNERVK